MPATCRRHSARSSLRLVAVAAHPSSRGQALSLATPSTRSLRANSTVVLRGAELEHSKAWIRCLWNGTESGVERSTRAGFIGTREAVKAWKPSRATSRRRDPQVTQRERTNTDDAGYRRARLLFCPGWRSTRRDDRLPSLPVAQRSLNGPAPLSPKSRSFPR